jgi:protein disulfide-isomerase A1
MAPLSLVCIVLVHIVICCTRGVKGVEDATVIKLTKDTFNDAIDKNPYVLVEFYAPWCGHCKALAPEYEKAAQVLQDHTPAVTFAKVDATAEEELGTRFRVRGFPTLKFFKHGREYDYAGGRTEGTIVEWVKKRIGPPSKSLNTVVDIDAFKTTNDVVVVGFFDKGDAGYDEFQEAAESNEEIPFGIAPKNLATPYEMPTYKPGIILFRSFDNGDVIYDKSDFTKISEWVESKSMSLIVEFNQETATKIFGGKIKTHILVFMKNEDESETVKMAMRSSASRLEGKMLFVSVYPDQERIMEFFGIGPSDLPTARLINMGDGSTAMRKYVILGDIESPGTFDMAYTDYTNGKLKADLKSQEIPHDNNGPVTIVVGKNFDDVVLNSGKDVFIEFYAPWCGHCKRLTPVWEELGETLSDVESITIAKMDATANEHEKLDVSGFPTIKLYKSAGGDPLTYEGSRTLDGFLSYLKEESSDPSKIHIAGTGNNDDKKDEL